MPRINDMSYHQVLRRPEFYNDEQREEHIQKRIDDAIYEKAIPPLPTRQQELDYLEELEKDFRSDPWLHNRFRKLQAGPFRIPYKKTRELVEQQRMVKLLNFLLGAILVSPLAIGVGRRLRVTSGGVPRVYFPKNWHMFPNVQPDHNCRNRFRLGFYGTMFLGGYLTMIFWTPDVWKDEYFSRPDFKPTTPMVEDTPDIQKAKDEFYSSVYQREYTDKKRKILRQTPFYRLFRPNYADYNVRFQDRRNTDHEGNTYRNKIGAFPSESRMHEHHWH